jgi:hypothetical protein
VSLYFVETAAFTRRIGSLGLENELSALQSTLARNVAAGDIDPGTGGLRKLRVADPGRRKGKRGGARVHYLHLAQHDVVYLVFVYGKDEQSTLTPQQKRQLKRVAEALKAEWDTNSGEVAI